MSDHQDQIPQQQQEVKTQNKPTSNQTTKKQASYTYWVDQKNKSRQLPPQQRPQKIDPPKIVNQKNEDGRSHWNTAGTWEPKKISLQEIQKKYTDKINQWISENCPEAKVKEIQLKGQCEVVFIRMKKALTYEFTGKVEFQKKLKEQKKEQKQETETQQVANKQVVSSEDDKSDSNSDSAKKQENNLDISKKQENKAKVKPKAKITKKQTAKTFTFQIVDLTDHGDRQFKSKADDLEDKKFIASKSESLLILLEDILKSYK